MLSLKGTERRRAPLVVSTLTRRPISLPRAKPFDAYAAPGMADACGQWKPPRRGSQARFIAIKFERRSSCLDDHSRREDDKSIDARQLADAATTI